jgi:membrane-bound inhibitor of C-type lysozyme
MNRRKTIIFGTTVLVGAIATGASALAQQTSFQSYRCADGSQFIVGFFQYDKRAHLQIDGKPVALGKRLALSGRRYTGSGITLRMMKDGAVSLRHARRPVTACSVT